MAEYDKLKKLIQDRLTKSQQDADEWRRATKSTDDIINKSEDEVNAKSGPGFFADGESKKLKQERKERMESAGEKQRIWGRTKDRNKE